jgi:hypothetical protein
MVIKPLTNNEVFHLPSTLLLSKKKKTDAANMAIRPTKNVNPVTSPGCRVDDRKM